MSRASPLFADLPVRRKGMLVVAPPVVALLIVVIAPLFTQRRVQEAEGLVRHSVDVQRSLQLTLTLLLDAETGTRGYLLTGRQEWLEPYEAARRRLPAALADLEKLVADNPAQVARVKKLRDIVGDRLQNLVVLRNLSGPKESRDLQPALERSKASMDRTRVIFAEMQTAEETRRTERTRRLRMLRGRLYLWMLASVAIGLAGGLIGASRFGKDVAQRLQALGDASALLARRAPLPPPDEGRDEIGSLSRALHQADHIITSRDAQLRDVHLFLEHLVETSPTVVFRQDPVSMRVMYVSPNAEQLFGYSAAEILDTPDFWMSHIHPDDRNRVLEQDRTAMAARASQLEVEYRFHHKDGSYRWLDSFLRIEYDADGKPSEFLGHRLDVTDRHLAEEALREREAHLDAANRELQAFSYSVSHDLRAPLRSIDGFSQALVEDYGDKLDRVGCGYLQRVRAATQRMGELIDDLLELSRVTRSPLRRAAVDLSAMAESIAAELRQNEPRRAVEFAIQPGLHEECDSNLTRVVLENLIGNAWKFTSKHPTARIEFGRDDGLFFVRDDGAGFDPAYKTKLFGAFQRLHHAADFDGTGIGLATVLRIVRRHGGDIRAEGQPEKGAAFYFTLRP